MTDDAEDLVVDLPCHRCGYDLRAHPPDGQCPECAASVAESRRRAAVPLRPAWRDSDRRWRRRLLAGAWLLVLVPLLAALETLGWDARVPVPNVLGFPGTIRALNDTFLGTMDVYQSLVFCMGVVLLFATERGRRRGRLDWTRRWGIGCSYVVLLLCAAQVLFLAALVSAGLGALFHSMPPEHQPRVTGIIVDASTAYLRHGPHPDHRASVVLAGFSSLAVLLACVALFDALRSSGPPRFAAALLAPLALFALMHLADIGRYCLGLWGVTPADFAHYQIYFRPELLAGYLADPSQVNLSGSTPAGFVVEVAKWCSVLGVALWLSIAQLASARRRRRNASTAMVPDRSPA